MEGENLLLEVFENLNKDGKLLFLIMLVCFVWNLVMLCFVEFDDY